MSYLTLFILVVAVFTVPLSGCSPSAIRVSEEVIDAVAEEELKEKNGLL